MGKISGYPLDNDVQPTDILIGSDVADQNGPKNLQTKNFSVAQILSVAGSPTYVPYTGAIANVDLGAFGMMLMSIVVAGSYTDGYASIGVDGEVLSVDEFGLTKWIPLPAAQGAVPYTGATDDVDLGSFSLSLGNITLQGTFKDRNGSVGTAGQVLVSAAVSGTEWRSDLLDLSAVKTQDLTITENLYDSASVAATAGALLTGDATGKPIWFAPLEVLRSSTTDVQAIPSGGISGSQIKLGESMASTPYVSFDGYAVTFLKAGTYAVQWTANATVTVGYNVPLFLASTNGNTPIVEGAIISGPHKLQLDGVEGDYISQTDIITVEANDQFEVWTGRDNSNDYTIILGTQGFDTWVSGGIVPSASIIIVKIA